jgi:hypothetical protein
MHIVAASIKRSKATKVIHYTLEIKMKLHEFTLVTLQVRSACLGYDDNDDATDFRISLNSSAAFVSKSFKYSTTSTAAAAVSRLPLLPSLLLLAIDFARLVNFSTLSFTVTAEAVDVPKPEVVATTG